MGFFLDAFNTAKKLGSKAVEFGSRVAKPILSTVSNVAKKVSSMAGHVTFMPGVGVVASQVKAASDIVHHGAEGLKDFLEGAEEVRNTEVNFQTPARTDTSLGPANMEVDGREFRNEVWENERGFLKDAYRNFHPNGSNERSTIFPAQPSMVDRFKDKVKGALPFQSKPKKDPETPELWMEDMSPYLEELDDGSRDHEVSGSGNDFDTPGMEGVVHENDMEVDRKKKATIPPPDIDTLTRGMADVSLSDRRMKKPTGAAGSSFASMPDDDGGASLSILQGAKPGYLNTLKKGGPLIGMA